MKQRSTSLAQAWMQLGSRYLPFADAATVDLPLGRLLRLSLFQVSVGMAVVLLNGILNRVMIVELSVPTWLVAVMVSLPLLFAPFRALVGHKSDTHKSYLGWRRVPYIWFGTLLQFGGLAIMPFALLVLSGDTHGPSWIGHAGAALAFLLVGAGLHTTQTAGLALATDLAPPDKRPRVVALLYVMLLVGMLVSSIGFGALLADFGQIKLIQVIQAAALITIGLNILALWKQEVRDPSRTRHDVSQPDFISAWRSFSHEPSHRRIFIALGLGTAGFSMQDILLEPYGGQILNLSVSATTILTAILAGGTLIGFAAAARSLGRGGDTYRLAALGTLVGICAFSAVVFADPLQSPNLFRIGAALIGFGGGLFSVGMLVAAMSLANKENGGLVLGVWGAIQATAAGVAIALGGTIRDVVTTLAEAGLLGPAMTGPSAGYSVVYHIEILLLFVTLIAVGPLVRNSERRSDHQENKFGLASFPS
ncbi:MAG: BCD family MFS transporter [Pseudomonadota bacterium]